MGRVAELRKIADAWGQMTSGLRSVVMWLDSDRVDHLLGLNQDPSALLAASNPVLGFRVLRFRLEAIRIRPVSWEYLPIGRFQRCMESGISLSGHPGKALL